MSTIEQKAFETYQQDRAKAPKYQTPDNCWMDWYRKGFTRAQMETDELMKKRAVVTHCKCCEWRESNCPKETCISRNEFIQELNETETDNDRD